MKNFIVTQLVNQYSLNTRESSLRTSAQSHGHMRVVKTTLRKKKWTKGVRYKILNGSECTNSVSNVSSFMVCAALKNQSIFMKKQVIW